MSVMSFFPPFQFREPAGHLPADITTLPRKCVQSKLDAGRNEYRASVGQQHSQAESPSSHFPAGL